MEKKEETKDYRTLLHEMVQKQNPVEEKTDFRSEQRKAREALEMKIYEEFEEYAGKPNASKVEVAKYLCRKYGIGNVSTIYAIRKRVEKRITEAAAN